MMEHKDNIDTFEARLKETLTHIEPPFEPQHWDKMAEKLAQLDQQEADFDAAIARAVQSSMPPMPPSDWDKMSAALDGHFVWPAKMLRYKLVECVVLLLLLVQLTEMPFWEPPTEGGYPMPVRKVINPDNVPPIAAAVVPKKKVLASNNNTNKNRLTASKALVPTPIVAASTVTAAPSVPPVFVATTASIPTLRPQLLSVGLNKPILTGRIAAAHNTKAVNWHWGWFTGPSMDNIFTNYARDGRIIHDAQTVMNVSAGVYIGRKKGRVQTNMGLTYHSKAYVQSPIKNKVTQGSFLKGYTTIDAGLVQFDVFSADLSTQYSFFEKGAWSAYLGVGGSAYVVMHTRNDKQVQYTGPQLTGSNGGTPKTSAVDLARYSEGLLLGGRLNDNNYYISAQVALGLDYKINKRTTLYIQPTHQIPLGRRGIGSRQDKIHSTHLYIGARLGF